MVTYNLELSRNTSRYDESGGGGNFIRCTIYVKDPDNLDKYLCESFIWPIGDTDKVTLVLESDHPVIVKSYLLSQDKLAVDANVLRSIKFVNKKAYNEDQVTVKRYPTRSLITPSIVAFYKVLFEKDLPLMLPQKLVSIEYMFNRISVFNDGGLDLSFLPDTLKYTIGAFVDSFKTTSVHHILSLPETLPELTDARYMFQTCYKLREITGLNNLPKLLNAWGMFNSCQELQTLVMIDWGSLAEDLDIEFMFAGCRNLNSDIKLSNVYYSKIREGLFRDCINIKNIHLSPHVPGINSMNLSRLCKDMTSLIGFTIDLGNSWAWLNNTSSTFEGCENLREFKIVNIPPTNNWISDNMTNMFKDCINFNYNLSGFRVRSDTAGLDSYDLNTPMWEEQHKPQFV